MPTASQYGADLAASVRDDPAGRLALMASLYTAEAGRPELHLPYRRAALGFMGWQLRRGVLNTNAGGDFFAASNWNDAKPQMAMTAIQFPDSLIACPARSTANPRTRSTRIPAR